jgi:hypothetical protein
MILDLAVGCEPNQAAGTNIVDTGNPGYFSQNMDLCCKLTGHHSENEITFKTGPVLPTTRSSVIHREFLGGNDLFSPTSSCQTLEKVAKSAPQIHSPKSSMKQAPFFFFLVSPFIFLFSLVPAM